MGKKLKRNLLVITGASAMLACVGSTKLDDYVNSETINIMNEAYNSGSEVVCSGSCGTDTSYDISNDGVLMIKPSGQMSDYSKRKLPEWYKNYSGFIKKVVVLDGVTNLGDYAFFGFSCLEEVYIPKTVESVGENTFLACNENIKIYGNAETFIEKYSKEKEYEFIDVIDLTIDKEEASIFLDEEVELNCSYNENNVDKDEKIKWYSSDEEIAKVEEDGSIKCLKDGKTSITATIGGASATCNLEIKKYDINTAQFTIDEEECEYDKKEKEPKIQLKKDEKYLEEDKDYEIKYENNIEPGKAKITIEAKGSFKGKIEKEFLIKPVKLEIEEASEAGLTKTKIKWKKGCSVDSYSIFRAEEENGEYEEIFKTKNGEVFEYEDTNLETEKKYYYKVCGNVFVDGRLIRGECSDIKCIVPTIEKIQLDKSNDSTEKSIKISWKKNDEAKNYIIYRKDAEEEDSKYEKLETTEDNNVLEYTDNDVEEGKIYHYTVRGQKDDVMGNYYDEGIQATIVKPTKLKKAEGFGGFVTLTLENNEDADGCYIYRKKNDEEHFSKIGEVKNTEVEYTDNKVEELTEYEYMVRSFVKNEESVSIGKNEGNLSTKTFVEPKYEISASKESDMECRVVAVRLKNVGKEDMKVLSESAIMTDDTESDFDRGLNLIDYEEFQKSGELKKEESVEIKSGEEKWLMFTVDGYLTYYSSKTCLWFRFQYGNEDVTYVNKSSQENGVTFFGLNEESKNKSKENKKE